MLINQISAGNERRYIAPGSMEGISGEGGHRGVRFQAAHYCAAGIQTQGSLWGPSSFPSTTLSNGASLLLSPTPHLGTWLVSSGEMGGLQRGSVHERRLPLKHGRSVSVCIAVNLLRSFTLFLSLIYWRLVCGGGEVFSTWRRATPLSSKLFV